MRVAIIGILLAQFSYGASWLSDPQKSLCKDVAYNVKCKFRCDGRDSDSGYFFVDSAGKAFGSWYRSSCGKGNTCGYSFSLEDQKPKSISCEDFVDALQRKQKECKNCLKEIYSGDG